MNGLKPFSTGGTMATVGRRSGMILLFFLLSTTTTLVLSKPSFVTLSNKIPIDNYDLIQHKESISLLHKFRGGGSDVDVDSSEEVDSDDDFEDDSEELEAVEEESTLTQATKKSLKKKKQQAQKQIKETVSASLASSAMKENKKKKQTLSKTQSSSFKIPYILKALLNPFTVIAMTKGYFASLFNIDYLQEVSHFIYVYVVCTILCIIYRHFLYQ